MQDARKPFGTSAPIHRLEARGGGARTLGSRVPVSGPRTDGYARLRTLRDAMPQVRVLVVEDEAIIGLSIESTLLRAGYEVIGIADNAATALELVRQSPPDAVLMDISIRDGMDGIDLAAELMTLIDVPVVFLTAFGDDRTLERAAQVSPYGYIIKPYDERSLLVTLRIAVERHRTDARLRLLNEAISAATIGILLVEVHEAERRISFVNDAFLRMSGATREQALGRRPCFLAADPECAGVLRLQDAMNSVSAARETILGRRPTGEEFWSTVAITPVADRSGRVGHLIVFHLDITREREAEQLATFSQRFDVVGRLALDLAHDFDGLFGAIHTIGQLALADKSEEALRSDLEQIADAVRRGTDLTQRLSRLTRTEAEPTRRSAIDVGQLITDTRPLFDRACGDGAKVLLICDPHSMVVAIDPASFEQVLLNLVLNARDAMPSGGIVTIRASCPGVPSRAFPASLYVRVEVVDDGVGMSDATLARLFEPHFTTKPEGRGAGLGLVTSKRLVEEAGGSIEVTSRATRGTAVVIELPRLAYDPNEQLAANAVGPQRADGLTCVLVESDPQLRLASARILRSLGFGVFEFPTVEAACAQLDTMGARLDLLVCGSRHGGLGSLELIEHARQTSPRVGLLVLTSHLEDSLAQFGPGVDFLWKPFTPAALARRSLDIIGRRSPVEAATDIAKPDRPTEQPDSNPSRSSPRLLVVEPVESARHAMVAALSELSLELVEASTAESLKAALDSGPFDAAVVDLGVSGEAEARLIQELRRRDSSLPVVATALETSLDIFQRALEGRVLALLPKPVRHEELLEAARRAAAEGQLRRLQQSLSTLRQGAFPGEEDLNTLQRRFAESVAGIFMVFQPIVHRDGRVFGYEALLRSKGPCEGPLDLIGMAERLGRVEELGRVIRASIAATLVSHPDRAEPIFVNVHPHELRGGGLTRSDEPLLPWASRVVIEITERAKLGQASEVMATITSLRDKGFRVAVDDVGEGYAGLSWLISVAPDVTKIDMSLIRGIERSAMKRDVVASLVNLARRVNTFVVAEGIETEAEAQTVADLGCDLLQGYYFSRPGPAFPTIRVTRPGSVVAR